MHVLEDFGERQGRTGIIDEFSDAYMSIQPEAGDDLIMLALAICDCRIGKQPDWRKPLQRFKPNGAPN